MKATKAQLAENRSLRDLGLAAALSASGLTPRLEDHNGVIHFVFSGEPGKLQQLEDQYWTGTLKLPVREAFQHLRTLKDRLYAAKGSL